MNRHRKKRGRFLLICGVVLLLFIASVYFFLEYSGYFLLDKEKRNYVVENIKNSPELPERFYELYNKVYPRTLKGTPWGYYYRRYFTSVQNECPYRLAAYSSNYMGEEMIIASFYLSHFVRPEEALSFVLSNKYFGSIHGIQHASKNYFQKDMDELTDKEMLELIVSAINPSLYNKERYPEKLARKVEEIMTRINDNK